MMAAAVKIVRTIKIIVIINRSLIRSDQEAIHVAATRLIHVNVPTTRTTILDLIVIITIRETERRVIHVIVLILIIATNQIALIHVIVITLHHSIIVIALIRNIIIETAQDQCHTTKIIAILPPTTTEIETVPLLILDIRISTDIIHVTANLQFL